MLTELDSQSIRCAICASPRLRQFTAQASDTSQPTPVSIVECQDCYFAWQHPVGRTAQESVEHFDENYRAQGTQRSTYFDPSMKRAIASLELEFLSQLPTEGRRLLDIGAGAGIFAEVASERGWSVTAIDPALDGERLAGHDNIRAIRGTADMLTDDEPFDVVTMWDVIEHMTNPISALADARNRINEGGWIVVETGNYKSADRVREGIKHWMYQVDHRWYFSPDSMVDTLTKLGFSRFIHARKALRPGWAGQADYPGPSYLNLLKSVLKNPFKASVRFAAFRELSLAAHWPMAGIGIFAVAAQKHGGTSPSGRPL